MYVRTLRILAVVLVVFLCSFAGLSYVRHHKSQPVFDVEDGHHSSRYSYMADVFWNECGMDLINMNKAIEGLEQCKPGETNCAVQKFDSEIIRKAMKYLHPSMKESIRDCIVRKNLHGLVLGDDEAQSSNWYFKYLESVLPMSDVPRRFLAGEPAVSPSFPPEGSPTLSPQFPPSVPPPSPASPPPSSPPSKDPSVPISPTSNAPTSSKPDSGKSRGIVKAVAIAVAVTIPVTLLITALVIFCCLSFCGYALKKKDETENPPVLVSSVGKDKQSGRVSDQGIIASPSAGDLYPLSQSGVEALDQSSGFKYSKLPAVSLETSSSVADATTSMMSVPKPPPPPPKPPAPPPPPMVTSAAVPKPPAPPPPPMVTGASKPPAPPPPPMVTGAPKPPAPPLPPMVTGAPKPPAPPPPTAPKPPGPPGAPPKPPTGPRPPVPPKNGAGPPRPPGPTSSGPRPPPGLSSVSETEPSVHKTKLKPFFWDKVLANNDSSMAWHQIKAGSFQFDESKIESLFGSGAVGKNKTDERSESAAKDPPIHYIKLIDSRKAQNISILLKALNLTTEEVCDALLEGYELPTELFQTFLKMAPTQEEELKLRAFSGDIALLGPAERFLKALVEIPFAFKRIECLIFATSIQEEVSSTKQSFATLEVACKELKSSRLFFKLLEAVLKTGNRMNDGTFRGSAQAFKLETLLKLADVKGTDGKTTLLHFVVQEIIRSEGIKAACAARGERADSSSSIKLENDTEVTDTEEELRKLGLEVVSHLSAELGNVKKAAALDAEGLASSVTKLTNSLNKTRTFLDSEVKNMTEESGFYQTIKDLVQNAEVDVSWLVEEEKRIMALVKSTGNYFHGSTGKDEGLQLFGIVRDFLIMVDKVCNEVKNTQTKPAVKARSVDTSSVSSSNPDQIQQESAAVLDMRQRLFPAIADRRVDTFSSDEED